MRTVREHIEFEGDEREEQPYTSCSVCGKDVLDNNYYPLCDECRMDVHNDIVDTLVKTIETMAGFEKEVLDSDYDDIMQEVANELDERFGEGKWN